MDSYKSTIYLFLSIFGIVMLILLPIIIFSIIVKWKMYKKAGKEGWEVLIPVYNTITLFDIIGYKWYYIFFLALNSVPYIGSIIVILFSLSYNIKLAKSFNQSTAFGVGLAFLNPIFVAIIAFNKDIKYIGPTVDGDIDFNDLF